MSLRCVHWQSHPYKRLLCAKGVSHGIYTSQYCVVTYVFVWSHTRSMLPAQNPRTPCLARISAVSESPCGRRDCLLLCPMSCDVISRNYPLLLALYLFSKNIDTYRVFILFYPQTRHCITTHIRYPRLTVEMRVRQGERGLYKGAYYYILTA